MPETDRFSRIFFIFIVVAILFALGVVKLFLMRFEAGDVYPPYSSLRADPLGSMALYESFDHLPDISVARNFAPLEQLKPDAESTLFFLGLRPRDLVSVPEKTLEKVESVATEGGQVVLAFFPESGGPPTADDDGECPENEDEVAVDEDPGEEIAGQDTKNPEGISGREELSENDPGKDPDEKEKSDGRAPTHVSLFARWGFAVKGGKPMAMVHRVVRKSTEEESLENFTEHVIDLPAVLEWHTGLSFELDHGGWQVVYAEEDRPVVVFRKFGRGSLVIIADSYPMSNEALMEGGDTRFLAWLAGAGGAVIFDESHFGIRQQQGIASLIRKYQLSWFIAGLFVIALLVIWKNSVSFIPPTSGHEGDEERAGFDHRAEQDLAAGLVSLLRRHIAPKELLSVSLAEWRKSGPAARMVSDDQSSRIEAIVKEDNQDNKQQTDPVQGYRKICGILAEEK